MNKQQSMYKRWPWIMGAITLLVSLFFPHLWGPARASGFFWQLSSLHITGFIDRLILLFPPCALTASIIWCWSRQMNRRVQVIRALVVVLEAAVLSLPIIVVFIAIISIITAPRAVALGIALAILNTMWAGVAFLAFLPCLLIVAVALAGIQSKNQVA